MATLTPAHRQRLEQAAYVLRIVDGGKPHPVPGNAVATDGTFPLPIPPQSIKPRQDVRVGIMETRSGALADEQGSSPPEWEISGQFLLTPKEVNGVRLDAYGFQRALEGFISYYAEENRRRALAKKTQLGLEFFDFYADQHWRVVPRNVPLGNRDSGKPLNETYSIRLKGLHRVGAISNPNDAVKATLSTDPNVAVQGVCPHPEHA